MTREEHIYQLKQYLQGKSISMCPASSLYWQEHWEEVIKALEQESTTKNDLGVDCVSRAEVKKIAKKMYLEVANMKLDVKTISDCISYTSSKCREVLERELQALPSVTPQEPRWIPVSERLPNDRDWYLGIFKEPDTGWINRIPFICDYVGRETKATTKEYWILRGCTDRDEHIDYYFNLECVAWMPLPKPYEEVEE